MTLFEAEALATLLNFAVVVFILFKAGKGPAREFFQSRSKDIGAFVSQARSVSTEARAQKDLWAAKLANAPAEMSKQRQDAETSLKRYSESTLARANAEAVRIDQDSKVVIAAESQRAKRTLRRQLALESVEQARAYLGRNVDSKDNEKLLGDYLERVSDGHAG